MVDGTIDADALSKRRKFIKGLIGFFGVATVAGMIYPFVRYLQPVKQQEGAGGVEIPETDLPPGKAVLINYEGNPALVINTGTEYVALTAICPHLGCIVKWKEAEGILFCPCHAGKFDTDGKVLAGPPPQPLEKFPVRVAGGKVILGGA